MGEDEFVRGEETKEAWWYVGRFLYEFAQLEASINEAFQTLFNMDYNATLYMLLAPRLNFIEKVELIGLGLKKKEMDIGGLINNIRGFAEVRNIVAHSVFGPDDRAGDRGISFDYLSKNGKIYFTDKVRKFVGEHKKDSVRSYGEPWDTLREFDRQNPGKDSWITSGDSFISYDAFNDLDHRMKHLTTSIDALAGACVPLSDGNLDEETIERMKAALNRNVTPGDFPS